MVARQSALRLALMCYCAQMWLIPGAALSSGVPLFVDSAPGAYIGAYIDAYSSEPSLASPATAESLSLAPASFPSDEPSSTIPLRRSRAQMRAKIDSAMSIAREARCAPSVCFALDGSKRLTPAEFKQQADFAKLVAAVISLDARASLAAVRYARRATSVAPLGDDAEKFLLAVDGARRLGGVRSE
ncbi:unnamed protein product, partial [Agarophyton chilense]